MRTTFSEMHLFNDNCYKQETSFICGRKEWGIGRHEGERQRERVRCRVWVEKGYSVGKKLDCWSSMSDCMFNMIKCLTFFTG